MEIRQNECVAVGDWSAPTARSKWRPAGRDVTISESPHEARGLQLELPDVRRRRRARICVDRRSPLQIELELLFQHGMRSTDFLVDGTYAETLRHDVPGNSASDGDQPVMLEFI